MEPGELIARRYRIRSLVGRGAMGVVWLATDERLDRQVAIKQLVLDAGANPDGTAGQAHARAIREGRIAGQLRHPNAIAVHDIVEHDGRPCLVMDYLEAENLAARGTLPPVDAARIGAQVAAALAAAHAAGIVHRDVKPDNVLITADGTAKITDFGVSRAAGHATVTTTGLVAGTPAYLAPEVAAGGEADARSDVFSLGATLYAAVEGMPPFGVDDNPIALLHRVAAGEPRPATGLGELTGTVLWLLRRDPADRPTMADARAALEAVADGRPALVPPPPVGQPTLMLPARKGPSRRAVLTATGGAVLVAAGVVLGSLLTEPDSTGATAPPRDDSTSPTMTATTPAGPACVASYEVTDSWPGGYQARVSVRNDGDDDLTGWSVDWTPPDGHDVDHVWNGEFERNGSAVTVTNADWNVTVRAGSSTTFGMNIRTPRDDRPVPEVHCRAR